MVFTEGYDDNDDGDYEENRVKKSRYVTFIIRDEYYERPMDSFISFLRRITSQNGI